MPNVHDGGGWGDGEAHESSLPPELSFEDTDAWRGGSEADDEAWRGDRHGREWPRCLAGPEYLMWKRLADGRED